MPRCSAAVSVRSPAAVLGGRVMTLCSAWDDTVLGGRVLDVLGGRVCVLLTRAGGVVTCRICNHDTHTL